jgi:MFS family permease
LTLSAIIAAIGLFLFSTAESFTQALWAQIITAVGFSTSYVGAIYLASACFTAKRFAFMSSLTLMSANIMSALLITLLVVVNFDMSNFRGIIATLSIITLILSLFLFLCIQNRSSKNTMQKSEFWQDLRKLLQVPQFWLGVIYFSTNFGVLLAFSSLWNIPDSLAYGHNIKTATMLSATFRFGSAFGAILAGLIVSSIRKCSATVKWYNSGALLLGAFLIYGPVFPLPMVFCIFALWGFFLGGASQGFPLVGQYLSPALKGTGFGIMTAMGYLLCSFLQYIIGELLKGSATSFKIALTPLAITLALGWMCSFWLKDAKNL